MSSSIVNLVYLIAGILFILGIKGLTKPSTAVRGNMLSALGMLIAVVVTLLNSEIVNFTYIVAGVLFGGAVGAFMALRIQMTSMPQMVALLNGFGGGASLTIASAEYFSVLDIQAQSFADLLVPMSVGLDAFGIGAEAQVTLVSIGLTILIGAVTLTGSLVAFAKLQGLIKKNIGLPGGPTGNALLLLGGLTALVCMVINPGQAITVMALVALALLLGLLAAAR